MPLAPGTRLGPYEIVSELGVGGMGEVYRAHDIKLGRDVALKVLPESFVRDPERLARFEREARVLAALNHPHIAHIHGFEDSTGTPALVMELVEGMTLAELIDRAPGRRGLPFQDAVSTARQIAEALEAAHAQGIIHRDLKPANVKVTADGSVKVLDFGLAKLTDPPDGSETVTGLMPQAPTITSPAMMTNVGVILGTAAYMSPEQAKGRSADKRSDIWAFGCVLYEMLTGRRAFQGEDISDTLAAVLTRTPDLTVLPASTPPGVQRLIARCLHREPARRLHDIADARLDLEEADGEPGVGLLPATEPVRRRSWVYLLPVAAVSVVVGAIGAWMLKPASRVDRAVTKAILTIQPAERFPGSRASLRPSRTALALSPDGRTIVFSAVRGQVTQLFKLRLDETEATPLTGTEGAVGPFFQPRGEWVGFWAGGKIKKVPVAGGLPVEICNVPTRLSLGLFGANWGEDDSILFSADGEGIARVSAAGGAPSTLTHADPARTEALNVLPFMLPGGKAFLYTVVPLRGDWEHAAIVVQSLTTGAPPTVLQNGADARYAPSGDLIFMRSGTLMSAPFDPGRLKVGSPIAVLDGVMQAIGAYNLFDDTGAGQFSVSANGNLAYLSGGLYPERNGELVWVDRNAPATPVPIPGEFGFALGPRLSPDGSRIAFFSRRSGTRGTDIWVYNFASQNSIKLTTEGNNDYPVWSPDSKNLVIQTEMPGGSSLNRVLADRPGRLEPLTPNGNFLQIPASWSGAAKVLAFLRPDQTSGNQLWILPMAVDGKATPASQVPIGSTFPEFSRDGHWLAFSSLVNGRPEVFVQGYPEPGELVRVSIDGGTAPLWAHSGRELFFLRSASADKVQVMACDIDTSKGFRCNKPRLLFEGPYGVTSPLRSYDIQGDDRHFLMIKTSLDPEPPFAQMHIVLNWFEELKARSAAK